MTDSLLVGDALDTKTDWGHREAQLTKTRTGEAKYQPLCFEAGTGPRERGSGVPRADGDKPIRIGWGTELMPKPKTQLTPQRYSN